MKTLLMIIPLFLMALATAYPEEFAPEQSWQKLKARVTEVVDGDTLHIILNGGKATVRLMYIDTMEKSANAKAKKDYKTLRGAGYQGSMKQLVQMGKNARIYLSGLLKPGSEILLAVPPKGSKDRYGRWLGIVWYKGASINLQLVREGQALCYFYTRPPLQIRQDYMKAQQEAQAERKGIWAQLPLKAGGKEDRGH